MGGQSYLELGHVGGYQFGCHVAFEHGHPGKFQEQCIYPEQCGTGEAAVRALELDTIDRSVDPQSTALAICTFCKLLVIMKWSSHWLIRLRSF